MPTSTQKGFSIGKWESNYLRCRFRAHRNKVASVGPAIDSRPPPDRAHVRFKGKKALNEERRQSEVMAENLRILTSTAEIMRNQITSIGSGYGPKRGLIKKVNYLSKSRNRSNLKDQQKPVIRSKSSQIIGGPPGVSMRARRVKSHSHYHHHSSDSITAVMKRNTHVVLNWFLRKFGKYVPWWAQVTY